MNYFITKDGFTIMQMACCVRHHTDGRSPTVADAIVLVYLSDNEFTPYCTYLMLSDGTCSHGDYHKDYELALRAYRARAASYI